MHKPNAAATLNSPFPQPKDDTFTISALRPGRNHRQHLARRLRRAQESRLVAASGTLVNLVAALLFWLALRNAPLRSLAPSSVPMSGLQSLRPHRLFLFLWRHNFGADFP
jgi:hypothetical protein